MVTRVSSGQRVRGCKRVCRVFYQDNQSFLQRALQTSAEVSMARTIAHDQPMMVIGSWEMSHLLASLVEANLGEDGWHGCCDGQHLPPMHWLEKRNLAQTVDITMLFHSIRFQHTHYSFYFYCTRIFKAWYESHLYSLYYYFLKLSMRGKR